MKIFVQLLAILVLFNKIEILNIFGKVDCTKKRDHILEKAGATRSSYFFKNHKC